MNTLSNKRIINIAGHRILLNSIVSYCEADAGGAYHIQKYPVILINLISGESLTIQTKTNVSTIIQYLDSYFETAAKFE